MRRRRAADVLENIWMPARSRGSSVMLWDASRASSDTTSCTRWRRVPRISPRLFCTVRATSCSRTWNRAQALRRSGLGQGDWPIAENYTSSFHSKQQFILLARLALSTADHRLLSLGTRRVDRRKWRSDIVRDGSRTRRESVVPNKRIWLSIDRASPGASPRVRTSSAISDTTDIHCRIDWCWRLSGRRLDDSTNWSEALQLCLEEHRWSEKRKNEALSLLMHIGQVRSPASTDVSDLALSPSRCIAREESRNELAFALLEEKQQLTSHKVSETAGLTVFSIA